LSKYRKAQVELDEAAKRVDEDRGRARSKALRSAATPAVSFENYILKHIHSLI